MLSKCKIKHFSASVQEICRFSTESDGVLGKKQINRIINSPVFFL